MFRSGRVLCEESPLLYLLPVFRLARAHQVIITSMNFHKWHKTLAPHFYEITVSGMGTEYPADCASAEILYVPP